MQIPHPASSTPKRKRPFDIHQFLRELKIIIVDIGGIVILSIWLWHEAAYALMAQ